MNARENPIVHFCGGDKDRAIELLSEACARLQEQLEREKQRQSFGFVYRGRESTRPYAWRATQMAKSGWKLANRSRTLVA